MIGLDLVGALRRRPRLLCLGAHADDIEIGCGGTVLRLAQEVPGLEVTWVVVCSNPQRAREAHKAADLFLEGVGRKEVIVQRFRDGFLPYLGPKVKEFFEELKGAVDPTLIFTHTRADLHQDHRTVCELTWNSFRDHLVLEYEIPKWDGDLGTPNLFSPLAEETCRRKIAHLEAAFASQRSRDWFRADTFWALLRLRGIEARAPSGLAEAFHGRKLVV